MKRTAVMTHVGIGLGIAMAIVTLGANGAAQSAAAPPAPPVQLSEATYYPPPLPVPPPVRDAAVAVAAAAEPQRLHRFTLLAMTGFGTPVGLFGGVAEFKLAEAIALGVGAGGGLQGLQLAALADIRPVRWTGRNGKELALSIMPAYSTGPWESLGSLRLMPPIDGPGTEAATHRLDRAHWLQADLGLDIILASGIVLRPSVGFAYLVNRDDAYCVTRGEQRVDCKDPAYDSQGDRASHEIFTMGFSIGRTFGGQ